MRAPYQIISIPYRNKNNIIEFCVMHRADSPMWQFISGGGEDNETPLDTAKRETFEEYGINPTNLFKLTSMAYIPIDAVLESRRTHWDKDICVIPEYAFAFECEKDPTLSSEHNKFIWLPYNEARKILKWDSNKVAMYEINERIKNDIK